MKRCLCVLLLWCLSVQSVWAAVGAYCGPDEGGVAGTRAGLVAALSDCFDPCHRQHATSAAIGEEPASMTADCGSCHAQPGVALLPGLVGVSRPASHAAPSAAMALSDLLLPTRPERPRWAAGVLA
ncbi:MAG: hypothetical protein REI94_12795 [Moraxellaceae bacterium]|nr:hypothetical protein [Moraxellaceae bacterium]